MIVSVVRLRPFTSEDFGFHRFRGEFGSWSDGHRFTSYIRQTGNICGGSIEITPPSPKVVLQCRICGERLYTGRNKLEFNALWALMSLQIHFGPSVEDSFGRLLPERIILEDRSVPYHPTLLVWRHLRLAAIPTLHLEPEIKDWQAKAIFEVIRVLTDIHGSSIKVVTREMEDSLKRAHSTFGWLYPR